MSGNLPGLLFVHGFVNKCGFGGCFDIKSRLRIWRSGIESGLVGFSSGWLWWLCSLLSSLHWCSQSLLLQLASRFDWSCVSVHTDTHTRTAQYACVLINHPFPTYNTYSLIHLFLIALYCTSLVHASNTSLKYITLSALHTLLCYIVQYK